MILVKVRAKKDEDGRIVILVQRIDDESSYVIVREGENIIFDLNGGWQISSVANEVNSVTER